MFDIVFPKDNELLFISMAKKLSIKELIFVYPYKKDISKIKEKIDLLKKEFNCKIGLYAKSKDILKAKNICSFVISDNPEDFKYKPSLLFDLELSPRKDPTHFRNSGMNQVIAKFVSENNITIGFSFSSISKNPPLILGRISQNLMLCKKYKFKSLFASFAKSPDNMRSLEDLKVFYRLLQ